MFNWNKNKEKNDNLMLTLLETIRLEMNQRFSEIELRLKALDQNIELMERKILNKDLSDRQAYGQLHYQLEELRELRKELSRAKIPSRSKLEN